MQIAEQSAAIKIGSRGLPLMKRITHRRKLAIDSRNMTFFGHLCKIIFDPHGMSLPVLDYPVLNPNVIAWLDEPYARLALSPDQQDLLIAGPLPPLSNFPHPNESEPTNLPGWANRGGRRPVQIPQRYMERTTRFIGKANKDWSPDFSDPDTFFLIQPIEQILMVPRGSRSFGLLKPGAGADGSKMAFLVNPRTGEGHFIGGRLFLDTRLHTA